jgi:hypothetical protein
MVQKILIPIGFMIVGVFCVYPFLTGQESAKIFKLLAALICFVYGLGSLIYYQVKR